MKPKKIQKFIPHFQQRFRRGTSRSGEYGLGNIDDENGIYYGGVQNVKRPNYELLEAKRTLGLSPIGGVARLLMANVLNKNNRTEIRPSVFMAIKLLINEFNKINRISWVQNLDFVGKNNEYSLDENNIR